MSIQPPEAVPPITGHAAVDRALAGLDLSGSTAEQQAELARVHEELQRELNAPRPVPPS